MGRQSGSGSTSPRHRRRMAILRPNSQTVVDRSEDRDLVHLLEHHALAIVDSSYDAIYAKTLDGVIVSWNRAAEQMYGYSAREIIGKPASLLLPAELGNEMSPIMGRIKKKEQVEHYETARIRKESLFTVFSCQNRTTSV